MIIRKLGFFLLVVVFLAFSGGIQIGKHFCKGELIDFAVNSKVEKCTKAKELIGSESGLSFSKQSCCNTEIDFFQTDHSEKKQGSFSTLLGIKTNPVFDFIGLVKLQAENKKRIPPLLSFNSHPLYILHESYLI